MAKDLDDLWEGGGWEQPTTRYSPPDTPNAQMTEHVRRSQSIRRFQRRSFSILRRVGAILLSGAIMAGLVVVAVSHPASPLYIPPILPWEGGNVIGGNNGSLPESDSVGTPPTIQQEKFIEEDIVTLEDTGAVTLTPQEIYNKNLQTVAYIESMSSTGISAGTGIVLTEDGYIVTNAHVVAGATETWVALWDETIYPATLVGWNGDEDLAVLKIEGEGLTPATFATANDLQVGDSAYAIGNPLGAEYRSTFTDGIISAKDRYLDIDGVSMNLIQTTTPINMGNSGGALLNEQGQVVGITTIKIMSTAATVENMGFAIPSDRMVRVVNCMAQGIEILRPAMGITVYWVTDPMQGVLVDEVKAGSNAEKAGILVGDIITHANGEPLTTGDSLQQIMSYMLVGDVLTATINRNGAVMDVDIELSDFAVIHSDLAE